LNSKRVPHKSIREIGGKPLVSRAIAALNGVESIADTVLYCSDESVKEYVDPSLQYTFLKRDAALDADNATFNNVLESVIDQLDTDYIVFLSCTSPFLKSATISNMIGEIDRGRYDSAFAAEPLKSFCWFRGKPLNYDPARVPRTQELEPVYRETSALYIFSKKLFLEHRRRVGFNPHVAEVDLIEGWDIDTEEDMRIAQLIAGGAGR